MGGLGGELRGLAIAVALALACSGCGISVFSQRSGSSQILGRSAIDCRQSLIAPMVDTALAVFVAATGLVTAHGANEACEEDPSQCDAQGGVGGFAGPMFGVLIGASAGYGYWATSRCRDAHRTHESLPMDAGEIGATCGVDRDGTGLCADGGVCNAGRCELRPVCEPHVERWQAASPESRASIEASMPPLCQRAIDGMRRTP